MLVSNTTLWSYLILEILRNEVWDFLRCKGRVILEVNCVFALFRLTRFLCQWVQVYVIYSESLVNFRKK